jgi:decaprenyl-phosphate phosphoribosyltransferase
MHLLRLPYWAASDIADISKGLGRPLRLARAGPPRENRVSDGPMTSSTGVAGPKGLRAFVQAMRPRHWVKNGFVLVPLVFSGRFRDGESWVLSVLATLSFCLLSSAIYLLNDLCDAEADRNHPVKRLRAVASGRLSRKLAAAGAGVLLLLGLGLAGAVMAILDAYAPQEGRVYAWGFLAWAGAYVVLNLLYSLWLKSRPGVDVILISLGFVLRAMGGASAIAVPFSPWLIMCTFSLCLFIALTKRRSEVIELPPAQRSAARPSSTTVSLAEVEHKIAVTAAVALVMYILYCLADGTVRRFGSAHMIWTVPLVTYGLFRYDRLTRQAGQNDPVEVLVRDKVMWMLMGLYIVLVAALRTYGAAGWTKSLLDF